MQGYHPDGIYTAASDDALAWDILAMKNLGMNLLRKHIKVEPDRWYFHMDRYRPSGSQHIMYTVMPEESSATNMSSKCGLKGCLVQAEAFFSCFHVEQLCGPLLKPSQRCNLRALMPYC